VRNSAGMMAATGLAAVVVFAAPAAAGEPDVGGAERRIIELEPRVIEVPARIEHLTDGVVDRRTEESSDQVAISVASDVLFAFDSAELTPAAQALLADTAARIRDEAAGPVQVHGHTDSMGEPGYNQPLSDQRAAAVHGALVPLVGRSDLTYEVAGFGETQPVAPNEHPDGSDNPEGRQQNRRVTITFTRNGG
jgi:outer membrane protein OmpA-like peptidoglycan-associated protein